MNPTPASDRQLKSGPDRSPFGQTLRSWRHHRRLSQLDLSLHANISQRHLSWLETGRSQPSRPMVIALAEALEVPLRDRNQLLHAAGFAGIYQQRGLEEAHMTPVRGALRRMLDQQMPYPGMVLDREWNVLMTNVCADALLTAADPSGRWVPQPGRAGPNVALMTLHPEGLRPLITNWDQAAHAFVQRLRGDMARTADAAIKQQILALIELAGEIETQDNPAPDLLPMLTLDLKLGDHVVSLFSVISTLGTPQDITTDELRIESFFPADDGSDRLLRSLAAGQTPTLETT